MGPAQELLNSLCNRITNGYAHIGDVQNNVRIILSHLEKQNESLNLNVGCPDNFEDFLNEISKLPLSHAHLKSCIVNSIDRLEKFISRIPSVIIDGLFIPSGNQKISLRLMQDQSSIVKIISLESTAQEVEVMVLDNFESLEINGKKGQLKINIKLEGSKAKSLKIWNISGEFNDNSVHINNSNIENINNNENRNLLFNISNNSFVKKFLIQKENSSYISISNSTCENIQFNDLNGFFEFNKSEVKDIVIKSFQGKSVVNIKELKGNKSLGLTGSYSYLELADSEIGDVTFHNMDLRVGEISSTKFLNKANFEGEFVESLIFKKVTFTKAPRFIKEKMCIDIHFIGCVFFDFAASSISQYRLLKNKFSEDSNEREESIFASYELEARVKNTSWRAEPFFKLCSLMYSVFNSYGRSVEKPVIIYVLMIFIFTIIYHMLSVDIFFDKYSIIQLGIYWGDFIFKNDWTRSLFYSFFNSLGPLRYLLNLDFLYIQSLGGKSVVFFHNILASVNLYLIIAGIKKRFKQG